MCLILLAHRAHPRYPLVVAANREEFRARPTAPAGRWEDAPWILAGRDLRDGGTWMGVTRTGRWAAVTNFREAGEQLPDAQSRGELVSGFLHSEDSAARYALLVGARAAKYNGFNFLVGEPGSLLWLSNRASCGSPRSLAPGVYGLSNHLLDTPWPKVERGKRALALLLTEQEVGPEQLMEILLDRSFVADAELPTGVEPALERVFSTMFIQGTEYGTRSSSVLLVDREGRVLFVERTYLPHATDFQVRHYEFQIEPMA